MATAAIQSRTASIVVPSIHLGSFSPYPAMANDEKQPLRFSDDNTVPVLNDDKAQSLYPQRSPAQWRSQNATFPSAQSYSYNPNRTTPAVFPRTPSTPGILYPSSSQSPALPVQPPNSPAQVPGPPREVCVECMMRDEDMADVDVTGPGVWDRESDIYYHELCRQEEEEAEQRDPDQNVHPNSSSGLSSSAGCSRPRARGSKLTEGNLKIWLSMNPREPASRQQTLKTYLNTQNALLLAESKARIQAMQESRQLDDKMRDAYSELRRSAYDLGTSASALDDGGIKIRSPSTSGFGDDARHSHKRDTTLLENGMIIERVDVRKEQARLRMENRRSRKVSRDSLSAVDNRDRDATSLYSFQAAEGTASLRAVAPYDSSMSIGMATSRSVRSMYTTPSSSWQPPMPNRPMSMAPGLASQTSLDSAASPRRRFFGMRQWSGYFGSNTSLMQSGSMVDMHLGLDQDKNLARTAHVDIGSNAPSLREAWPRMDDGTVGRTSLDRTPSTTVKKKKRRGIGKLWRIITGTPTKAHDHPGVVDSRPPHQEEDDEDLPLAPPPPLSYLVNRGNSQSERSMTMMSQGRHVSMPSLTLSNGAHHPRSNSAPSGVGVSLSSPSDQSSTLPSPTEVRFPYRDSSGDEREDGPFEEDAETGLKKKGSLSMTPPRPSIVNISETDFQTSSPLPMSTLALPLPQTTGTRHSSSSLTPTIKVPSPPIPSIPPVPPIRPMSMLSLDKSLPPLPPGEHAPPTPSPPADQPRSFLVPNATLPMASSGHHPQRELSAPNPGFRFDDAGRRQSFNGLASRPTLPRGAGKGTIPGMRYDDFGASRHSLAVFEPVPNSTGKRKSRFGIASLLGRKQKSKGHRQHASVSTMPASRSRELSFDGLPSQVPAPSLSEQSLSQQGLSTWSRRALDDIVPQDPDFVAYRYPSKDERLDLSRN